MFVVIFGIGDVCPVVVAVIVGIGDVCPVVVAVIVGIGDVCPVVVVVGIGIGDVCPVAVIVFDFKLFDLDVLNIFIRVGIFVVRLYAMV